MAGRTRVLGVGSPAGDDQAGWLAVDALAGLVRDGSVPDGTVEWLKLDRPGAQLVGLLGGVARVIVIDAMRGGGAVGTLRRLARSEWPDAGAGCSSHDFGVAAALALAEALGGLADEIEVWGVEIGSAEPGEEPSAAVRAAAGELATRLVRALSVGAVTPAED